MQTKPKAPPPFSLRLTRQERQRLDADAAASGLSLGAYIRARLFETGAGKPGVRKTLGRDPLKDRQVLGQLLAQLGKSRLATSLADLSKAARGGSLPVSPETESALRTACAELHALKAALMAALGIAER